MKDFWMFDGFLMYRKNYLLEKKVNDVNGVFGIGIESWDVWWLDGFLIFRKEFMVVLVDSMLV